MLLDDNNKLINDKHLVAIQRHKERNLKKDDLFDYEMQFPVSMFYANTMAGCQGMTIVKKLFLAFGDIFNHSIQKQV